jgi:hypothetical protein
MTLTIRPASAADLESAKQLLKTAGLPTTDLTLERLALTAEKNEVIRNTEEFAGLCPDDAVLMSKRLT